MIASNEHLRLIKLHTLHESDNLGEITKMFADKIIQLILAEILHILRFIITAMVVNWHF